MRLKIKDISIYISYPCLCLVSAVIISGIFKDYLLCFVCIVLHELGHLATMLVLGAEVSGINIAAFDVRIIENSRDILDINRDILITIAGPAANLLLFLAFYFCMPVFSYVNLFIAVFNLLPVAGMDGGQILFLLLIKKLSVKKSSFVVDLCTVIISVPLFIIGIMVLFYSKYNFSLLFLSVYFLLSLFFQEDKYL